MQRPFMRVLSLKQCVLKLLQILIAAGVMAHVNCNIARASDANSAVRVDAIPRVESDYISSLLDAYYWDLSRAYSADGTPELDWTATSQPFVRVVFGSGGLAVKICGWTSWPITLTKHGGIRVGRSATQLIGCGDESVTTLHTRVYARIQGLNGYDLLLGNDDNSHRLELRFSDGSRWELASVPRPETRYGTKGDHVLFEIAPEHVPCVDEGPPGELCMRVRQVNFETWPDVALSEWQLLYRIEGYTHKPGWQDRVYVTRYKPRKAPVGNVVYEFMSNFSSDFVQ